VLAEAFNAELALKRLRDVAKNVRSGFIVAGSMQAEAKVKICRDLEREIAGGLREIWARWVHARACVELPIHQK